MSNWLETNRSLGYHLTEKVRRARNVAIANEVRRILDVGPIDDDLIAYVMDELGWDREAAEKGIRQLLVIERFKEHIAATTPAVLRRGDADT